MVANQPGLQNYLSGDQGGNDRSVLSCSKSWVWLEES